MDDTSSSSLAPQSSLPPLSSQRPHWNKGDWKRALASFEMSRLELMASLRQNQSKDMDVASKLANTGDAGYDIKNKPGKLDPKLVGMSVGYKPLYAGREDQFGRFQWQETVPDVAKPAENAETQKWALVVRYVKEYDDPRKSLAIHSIVVQSPLLKEVLETVLANYPGVTVGLQRLEFSDKFESLIHRFPALNAEIDRLKKELEDESSAKDDQPQVIEQPSTLKHQESQTGTTEEAQKVPAGAEDGEFSASTGSNRLEHAELLRGVLLGEFQGLIESSQDMKAQGVVTYDYLWTLFEPGHLIYCRQEGQDRVFRLQATKYGDDRENNPIFLIALSYIDFDGIKFGWANTNVTISSFQGTRAIASLSAYPLDSHPDLDGLKAKVIERGSKIESFRGTHYRTYDGIGWRLDQQGQKQRQSVSGRVIIDAVGWNKYQANSAITVSRLDGVEASKPTMKLPTIRLPSEFIFDHVQEDNGGLPLDGQTAEEEDEQNKSQALTDEQKLLCTHLVRGYALKEKRWLNLSINSVRDITFNSHAFESLVLPENQKDLILGFTSTQQAYRTTYDDVTQGKGRGIILLLSGPPGVGKTLTAESVAEEMKVPLFVMSAGDLGMDSRTIEARLLAILGMCTRWNAILLLDEADIFLEERSLHEVERNKLVSIFLRVLEYHEGIMFLTTNRVQTFDPAFQSRIHVSVDYPELSVESRRTVWENFLKQHDITQAAARSSPPKDPVSSIKSLAAKVVQDEDTVRKNHEAMTRPHTIEKKEIKELARVQLNGRQIKNVLKTAQLLATHKREQLGYEHLATVLDVTQHLHNASQTTKRIQGSLYH